MTGAVIPVPVICRDKAVFSAAIGRGVVTVFFLRRRLQTFLFFFETLDELLELLQLLDCLQKHRPGSRLLLLQVLLGEGAAGGR